MLKTYYYIFWLKVEEPTTQYRQPFQLMDVPGYLSGRRFKSEQAAREELDRYEPEWNEKFIILPVYERG